MPVAPGRVTIARRQCRRQPRRGRGAGGAGLASGVCRAESGDVDAEPPGRPPRVALRRLGLRSARREGIGREGGAAGVPGRAIGQSGFRTQSGGATTCGVDPPRGGRTGSHSTTSCKLRGNQHRLPIDAPNGMARASDGSAHITLRRPRPCGQVALYSACEARQARRVRFRRRVCGNAGKQAICGMMTSCWPRPRVVCG